MHSPVCTPDHFLVAITSGRTFYRLHNLRFIELAQIIILYKDINLCKLLLDCSGCERMKKQFSPGIKTAHSESSDWRVGEKVGKCI